MTADMISDKKLYTVVTELFIRGQKLNNLGLHHTIILCCANRYKTKHHTFFHNKHSKKARNSTNYCDHFSDVDQVSSKDICIIIR